MFDQLFQFLKSIFGAGETVIKGKKEEENLDIPLKKIDSEIKTLKDELRESLKYLAEAKAMYIRSRRDIDGEQRRALEYESKARLLLQRAMEGQLGALEADRLATQALTQKENLLKRVENNLAQLDKQKFIVKKMEDNTNRLKKQILDWENELKSLQARARISEATKKMNQKLAGLDQAQTKNLLEDMQQRVLEQEALAEAYVDLNDERSPLDDEIEKALGGTTEVMDSLAKLKAELSQEQHKLQSPPKPQNDLDRLKDELNKKG